MPIALKYYVIELSRYIIAFLMFLYTSLSVFCIVSRKKKLVSICTSVQSGSDICVGAGRISVSVRVHNVIPVLYDHDSNDNL